MRSLIYVLEKRRMRNDKTKQLRKVDVELRKFTLLSVSPEVGNRGTTPKLKVLNQNFNEEAS
jgi:hypothetical protein